MTLLDCENHTGSGGGNVHQMLPTAINDKNRSNRCKATGHQFGHHFNPDDVNMIDKSTCSRNNQQVP
jgi:hypothetical protein